MALPEIRVEVGFDLTNATGAPVFKLDDPVQGRLDNTEYFLAGLAFVDVTDYTSAFNITRGKQPIDTNYPPGQAEVQFNNHQRDFDPLYPDSPFVGNIVPRREVRLFANDIEIYRGWIEDWNLAYTRDGDSIAIGDAYDALYLFNNSLVLPFTPSEELSGTRIETVLDKPEIAWPFDKRDIDTGQVTVAANELTEPANTLAYLQSIAGSDPGSIYVTRTGLLKFDDRLKVAASDEVVQFGGTGIPFDNVSVIYGAEQLFNEIVLTREGGGTVTVSDDVSIAAYGRRSWDITDSQVATDEELVTIGVGLVAQYSRPQYRFEALDVYMHKLTTADQNKVLALDFGDICRVTFTPNNIGEPVDRYVEIINIEHRVDVLEHVVTLGFDEIVAPPLRLDDEVFGRLDFGTLSW